MTTKELKLANDTDSPDGNQRGPVQMTDEELDYMADALWRISDLAKAGKVILGFAPAMVELEGNPALEGLFGILAGMEKLAGIAVKPIERNL